MTVAVRAMLRIREEMTERGITQRDLAETLHCSQGKVAKLLNGGVRLRLDELDVLARAVGLTLVEVVRDRGLEFFAEMTPTELRVLERLRRRPQALDGLMLLLDVRTTQAPKSHAYVPKRRRPGRPLTSESQSKRA